MNERELACRAGEPDVIAYRRRHEGRVTCDCSALRDARTCRAVHYPGAGGACDCDCHEEADAGGAREPEGGIRPAGASEADTPEGHGPGGIPGATT